MSSYLPLLPDTRADHFMPTPHPLPDNQATPHPKAALTVTCVEFLQGPDLHYGALGHSQVEFLVALLAYCCPQFNLGGKAFRSLLTTVTLSLSCVMLAKSQDLLHFTFQFPHINFFHSSDRIQLFQTYKKENGLGSFHQATKMGDTYSLQDSKRGVNALVCELRMRSVCQTTPCKMSSATVFTNLCQTSLVQKKLVFSFPSPFLLDNLLPFWQKEENIYYGVHMHLHVQFLWNDIGLLPHGQIMCSLKNNYQLECYKMGQQFHFAKSCRVVSWPPNTQAFFGYSLHQTENYTNLL